MARLPDDNEVQYNGCWALNYLTTYGGEAAVTAIRVVGGRGLAEAARSGFADGRLDDWGWRSPSGQGTCRAAIAAVDDPCAGVDCVGGGHAGVAAAVFGLVGVAGVASLVKRRIAAAAASGGGGGGGGGGVGATKGASGLLAPLATAV